MTAAPLQPAVEGRRPWTDYDLHIYGRRSDPNTVNTSLELQSEDVPRLLERHLGLPLDDMPYVKFYEERKSGADADVRLSFGRDGEIGLKGMRRDEYQKLLATAIERYEETRRPQIIACFMLNRLGRSKMTVFSLELASDACDGNLYLWRSNEPHRLLDPASESDRWTIWAEIEVAGKKELETKRVFVTGTKNRLARTSSDRALSERLVGYRRYPCDSNGNRLEDLSIHPDHYRFEVYPPETEIVRRIFDLAEKRLPASRIAAAVQAEFGPHPRSKRRWSRASIEWLVANPMYTGRRLYNRSRNLKVGSKLRRKNTEGEWIYGPHSPALQIIAQDQWERVQAAWRQRSQPGRRGRRRVSMGRPLGKDLYFHAAHLLKCGVCGAPMTVRRMKSHYSYRCYRMSTERALFTCQQHNAELVDADLTSIMQSAFQNVEEYRIRLRTDLAEQRDSRKLALLEERFREEDQKLGAMKASLWKQMQASNQSGKAMSSTLMEMLDKDIQAQAETVEDLSTRIKRFGQTVSTKQSEEILSLLDGMTAFAATDFHRRVELLRRMVEAVYLWPDGTVYIQWKGMPEAEALAAIEKELGRKVGRAKDWGPVDFVRVEQDARRLIALGEIPRETFFEVVTEPTITKWLRHHRTMHTANLLRVYKVAREAYLDMERFRRDVRAYVIQRQGEGDTLYRLEKEMGLSRVTVQRIADDLPVRRDSIVRALPFARDLTPYRALPEDLYSPPDLEEMLEVLGSWRVESSAASQVPDAEYANRGSRTRTPRTD